MQKFYAQIVIKTLILMELQDTHLNHLVRLLKRKHSEEQVIGVNAQELDVVFIKYQSPSIVCVRQSTSEKNVFTNFTEKRSCNR